jgi:hypothetical protein
MDITRIKSIAPRGLQNLLTAWFFFFNVWVYGGTELDSQRGATEIKDLPKTPF